jgi:hypothetical protein
VQTDTAARCALIPERPAESQSVWPAETQHDHFSSSFDVGNVGGTVLRTPATEIEWPVFPLGGIVRTKFGSDPIPTGPIRQ